MVLELSNQQFIILFLVWTALIFIETSLTHTHDIDAEETAIKAEEKIEKVVDELTYIWTPGEKSLDEWRAHDVVLGSGHKAPEGF